MMAAGAPKNTWNSDSDKACKNYFQQPPSQDTVLLNNRPTLSSSIHEFQELLSNLIPVCDVSVEHEPSSFSDLPPLKSPFTRRKTARSPSSSSSDSDQIVTRASRMKVRCRKKNVCKKPEVFTVYPLLGNDTTNLQQPEFSSDLLENAIPSVSTCASLTASSSRSTEASIKPQQKQGVESIRRIRVSRPHGIVGMQLYTPELLALSQNLQIYQNIAIPKQSNAQSQDWMNDHLVNSPEKLPDKFESLPPIPSKESSILDNLEEHPLYTSLPECYFDPSTRDLCVIWFEGNEKMQKRFSCKRSSRKAVYDKAEKFIMQIAGRSLFQSNYNLPYEKVKEMAKTKILTLKSQKEEIIYHYGGPYNATLMFKKLHREWIVNWTVDVVQQSVKWSCKKLGKLEAVTRAEQFVNSIANGNSNPTSPKRKMFWRTDVSQPSKKLRKSKTSI